MTSSTDNDNSNLPDWAKALYTLANLYHVDNKLYRSEQLEAHEAVLLTKYQIDAVINLRFFIRNHNEKRFASLPELQAVEFYNYPLMPWYVSYQSIAEILYHIRQLQNRGKSVLVHCLHGADRTGIIIAMYRIVLQGWSISHAKEEMIQGNFGYHVIWRNLESMLNECEVERVRQAYYEMYTMHKKNALKSKAN